MGVNLYTEQEQNQPVWRAEALVWGPPRPLKERVFLFRHLPVATQPLLGPGTRVRTGSALEEQMESL